MERRFSYLIVALCFVVYAHDALGSWDLVKPAIQMIRPVIMPATLPAMDLDTTRVTIVYWGDSLTWTANELRYMLRDSIGITDPYIAMLSHGDWFEPGVPCPIISVGTWSEMKDFFTNSKVSSFHVAPEDEGYFIWVTRYRAYVTANTIRGLNYAITSFWKACDKEGDKRWIDQAQVVDYPTFSRRYLGDPSPFHPDTSNQWLSPRDHAHGILSLGKEILLANKGNGLIHMGSAERYYNGAGQHVLGNIRTVLDTLQTGMSFGTSQGFSWGNFRFDWIENFVPWVGDEAVFPNNRRYMGCAIQIEKMCRTIRSEDTLWLVPSDTLNIDNPYFTDWDQNRRHFAHWSDSGGVFGWQQMIEYGDTFASVMLGENDTTWIAQSFHVQPDSGIPARLRIFEFNIRVHTSPITVRFKENFDRIRNGHQELDRFQVNDFHRNDSVSKVVDPDTAWQKLRVQFFTLGTPWDSVAIWLYNTATSSNRIDIDSVKIFDSEIYHFYPLEDNNSLADATIYRDGEYYEHLESNAIHFKGDEWPDWTPIHVKPRAQAWITMSPDSLAEHAWTAKLRYNASANSRLPAFISDLGAPAVYYDIGQLRTNVPDLAAPIVAANMQWFEQEFAESNNPGMRLSGWFNRGNELRLRGFMTGDTVLVHSNGWSSYSDVWAHFNSVMHSELNASRGANNHLPVFLYADMFNPSHNARRVTDRTNAFVPMNGQIVNPAEGIPGADPNAHLVFVDWNMGNHAQRSDSDAVLPWTQILTATPNNQWEVMLTAGPARYRDGDPLSMDTVHMRQMVGMAEERRENGLRFTGGGMLYDDKRQDSTNWATYRRYSYILRLWWKEDPVQIPHQDFCSYYNRTQTQAEATIRAYPIPYPEELVSHIDSVVLQYRFGLNGCWMTQHVAYQPDSLYDFKVDLPDSGGVMEYRFWAFDDFKSEGSKFGRYGSYPPRWTKWTDPDAGERLYLTFERRKTMPITTPETFYAPGVISQKYDIQAGGSVTIQPLPGYRYATMYVTNDAGFVLNKAISGFDPPKLIVAGTDSSIVHFASGNEDTLWKGLQIDITDSANVTLNYAQFSGAKMGLMINGMSGAAAKAKIEMDSCIMEKCSIGMALSTNVSAKVTRSVFRDCYDTGLMLVAQSRVSLDSCLVENNTNYGASISEGSEAQFEQTTIQGNGSNASIHAGVYVLNGGNVEFTCCDIKQNHALGIRGSNAAVIMAGKVEELSWGGNAIMQNEAPSPDRASEISITKCTVALDGGKNKFDGGANKPWIENLSGVGGIKGMRNNYWSNLDSEKVKSFIPKEVEYKPMLTSWQACSGMQADTASCAALYLSAVNKLDKKLCAAARSDFKQLIAQYPTCEYVNLAIEGILRADQMEGAAGTSATYFHGVAQAAQTVSIARGAYAAEAWSYAYSGRTDSAHTILQYLMSTAEGYMEIAASHLDLLSLELIALNMDTTQAPDADFLQAIKDSMDYWHKWLITDLNFTLEQGDVAGYCGDSTTIAAAIYPHNEFISTADDSITEVGFKFKSLPDSTNWTTWRVDSLSADSTYHWQVPVGRLGGLINYIFWAKDAHGRFATSPIGADTTYPDSGAAHFLSVEIAADTIRYPDSVVVWAPATITHNIAVMDGGVLVFKPYPGAADHTVRLGDNVWIEAMNYSDTVDENDPADYSKIFFLGTEQEPITVAPLMNSAGGDSTAWSDIGAYMYSNLMAKHTTFRTGLYSLNIGDPSYVNDPNHPGIAIDSCLFDTSSTTMLISGDDREDTVSYIRHTEFVQLGAQINEEPFGGLMISDAQIQMSDCRIHDNAREGLVLSWCWYSTFERVKVDHNHGPGLVFILGGSYPRFSCCEFSFNGDTLPEVQGVYGGPMPFSDQSNCVFMDSVGPLMKVWNDNTFDIHDGGNAFYLLGGNDKYIVRRNAGNAQDISGNYWYPVGPDSSAFLSFLTPDSAQFWEDSTHLDSFAMCESMQTSLPTVMAPRMGTGDFAAPTSSVNSTPTVATIGRQLIEHAQARQDLKQAKDWEKAGNHIAAAGKFRSLLSKPTDADITAEALSGYFMAARRSGVKTGLSSYYASLRQQLPTDALQRQAQWFELKSGLHPIFWTGHPSSLGGGAGLIVLKFVFFGRPVPEA